MIDSEKIQLWICLKKFLNKRLQILRQLAKVPQLWSECFRKIFHHSIAITLGLNDFMHFSHCLLNITRVTLQCKIALDMLGHWKRINPKYIDFPLLILDAQSHLSIQTTAKELFGAVRNRIPLDLFLDGIFFVDSAIIHVLNNIFPQSKLNKGNLCFQNFYTFHYTLFKIYLDLLAS